MDATRPPRRRATTRAHLIAAASAIFEETGSTGVRVESLCARAGFTRGAFYSNFTTVDEVFLAVHDLKSQEVEQKLQEAMDAAMGAEAPGSLTDVVHRVLGALPPRQDWFALRVALLTRAERDPDIAASMRQQSDRLYAALQPLVVDALERLGRVLVTNPRTLTRAVVAAHVGALGQMVLDEDGSAVREAAVAGVLRGLTQEAPEPHL